jgi:hypothetical protein
MKQSKLPESSVWLTVETLPEGQKYYIREGYITVDPERNIWVDGTAECMRVVAFSLINNGCAEIKKVDSTVEISASFFAHRKFKLRKLAPGRYFPVVIVEDKE